MKIIVTKDKFNITPEMCRHKYGFGEIIGITPVMEKIYEDIRIIAHQPINILITGETGTGKELVAKAIHRCGNRKDGPFIIVNCSSIPSELLESELFGHEKGAFTGAVNQSQGRFELADKGIIFLDEIGDMNISLQAKILRVLQDGKFYRIGGKVLIDPDIRIISATNIDLYKAVKDERFRHDLYYRLNKFKLHLPSLRQRKEDIPLLIEYFVSRYNKLYKRDIQQVSEDTVAKLMDYDWHGNVRELEGAIQEAVVRAGSDIILPEDLPVLNCYANGSSSNVKITDNHTPISLEKSEERCIRNALIQAKGNKTKAARMLGISWWALTRKLKKYHIDPKKLLE